MRLRDRQDVKIRSATDEGKSLLPAQTMPHAMRHCRRSSGIVLRVLSPCPEVVHRIVCFTLYLSAERGGIMSTAGIPIKLLFEAEGMKVTVEMKNGEIYRGLLVTAEDSMNMTLSDVVRTARNGQVSKLPSVYLRGSSVRFIALPELLKNAPVFKKVASLKKKAEAERSAAKSGAKRKRE